MTQPYNEPGGVCPSSAMTGYPPYTSTKTSGMSIASLVCGIVGMVTCCSLLPSILAIIFGGVALPPILRGEVQGRGLAISGLVTGVLGLLSGIVFLLVLEQSPANTLISGTQLPDETRAILESLKAVEPGETIDYFYPTGNFSIKESGIVLTPDRVVFYANDSIPRSCPLVEVRSIAFHPALNMLSDGRFVLNRESGDAFSFSLMSSGFTGDDYLFYDALIDRIRAARAAAGKALPVIESSSANPDGPETTPEVQ